MTTSASTSSTLLDKINSASEKTATPARARRVRSATGRAKHPMILVGGVEKCGKTYSIASASADPRVARLAVVEVGGDRGKIDAYGDLTGAAFEVVEHDNTWADVTAAIAAEVDAKPVAGGYNVLAIDGVTSLWSVLTRSAQRGGRELSGAGWSSVNAAWDDLLDVMRRFPGPVVLTARGDASGVVDDALGRVRTQRDLAFEVDAVVKAAAYRTFALTGASSLALARADVTMPVALGDLVLADLFDLLGGVA